MDLVQTITNAAVMAAVGTVLSWMMTGLRRELREEIASVRGEIAGLRTELHEEIRGVRSDLTQVALAVGVRPRAENE